MLNIHPENIYIMFLITSLKIRLMENEILEWNTLHVLFTKSFKTIHLSSFYREWQQFKNSMFEKISALRFLTKLN